MQYGGPGAGSVMLHDIAYGGDSTHGRYHEVVVLPDLFKTMQL